MGAGLSGGGDCGRGRAHRQGALRRGHSAVFRRSRLQSRHRRHQDAGQAGRGCARGTSGREDEERRRDRQHRPPDPRGERAARKGRGRVRNARNRPGRAARAAVHLGHDRLGQGSLSVAGQHLRQHRFGVGDGQNPAERACAVRPAAAPHLRVHAGLPHHPLFGRVHLLRRQPAVCIQEHLGIPPQHPRGGAAAAGKNRQQAGGFDPRWTASARWAYGRCRATG